MQDCVKNNFITFYADYGDFRDYIKNFINEYVVLRAYMKNNFITDYSDYADIQDYVKNSFIISRLR